MVAPDASAFREWEIPSFSDPNKVYTVKLWLEDFKGFRQGTLSCECPAWIFQRKPLAEKSCKHTRRVEEMLRGRTVVESVRGSEVMFNERRLREVAEVHGISRVEALKRELETP